MKTDSKKGKKSKHDLKNLFFLGVRIWIIRAGPRCRPGKGQKKSPLGGGSLESGEHLSAPFRGVMVCPETAEASPARLTDRQQKYILKLSADAGEGTSLASSEPLTL